MRPSCVDQWLHLKQRTVNIYPGLPRTRLINEKRARLSTYLPPRGIIMSFFLILCPHNPLSVSLYITYGLLFDRFYHTVEACGATGDVLCHDGTERRGEKKASTQTKTRNRKEHYAEDKALGPAVILSDERSSRAKCSRETRVPLLLLFHPLSRHFGELCTLPLNRLLAT